MSILLVGKLNRLTSRKQYKSETFFANGTWVRPANTSVVFISGCGAGGEGESSGADGADGGTTKFGSAIWLAGGAGGGKTDKAQFPPNTVACMAGSPQVVSTNNSVAAFPGGYGFGGAGVNGTTDKRGEGGMSAIRQPVVVTANVAVEIGAGGAGGGGGGGGTDGGDGILIVEWFE